VVIAHTPMLLSLFAALPTTAAGSYTYCSVPDSGMQGHQWDHPPGGSGDCVPGADYGICHHWSKQADAEADCNAWSDCAGYYMHPDKTDFYCMPRHPGPNTTWPPPGSHGGGTDSAGCEDATGGTTYIRNDAVCGPDGNAAFLNCHCACPACVPPSTKKCTVYPTADPTRNCSCNSPPPPPPAPPPPPLSENPCIRFGHAIPVGNHVDVEISQAGPPAISHTWCDRCPAFLGLISPSGGSPFTPSVTRAGVSNRAQDQL
jgi:hypothetical protein